MDDPHYTKAARLQAPGATVLAALTTPAGLAGWWTEVTGVGTRGGELRFTFGSEASATTMRVDTADPDLVAWTCVSSHVQDWIGTEITFALVPRADGTCDLSFRHHGLTPQLACYLDCQNGWNHFVRSLQDFVETGAGHPRGSAEDGARRELRAQRA